MKIDFNDKTVGGFNFEFVRGLSAEEAGAAAIGECMETIGRVRNGDFESWIKHWTATADRVSAFAERELSSGDTTSARKAFLRASNYYRMAVFYAAPTDDRHTILWQRSKDCFQRMIPLAENTIECLEVEFEGARLPAYFVSGGSGVRPTLIALGGFDSTMEEVYGWIGEAAADYGWNCLIFEGPGQWSALKNNPGLRFRPDYEKPVSAVVDCLVRRPDVDPSKLALIGYSFGGYLAPRAAAGEPRIGACIPNALVVDCAEAASAGLKGLTNPWVIDTAFGLLMRWSAPARWGFQHTQWTLGIRQPHEWPAAYASFTLRGLEDRFKKPMLFCLARTTFRTRRHPPGAWWLAYWISFGRSLVTAQYTYSPARRGPPATAKWEARATRTRSSSAGSTTCCAASRCRPDPTPVLRTSSLPRSPTSAVRRRERRRAHCWRSPIWCSARMTSRIQVPRTACTVHQDAPSAISRDG
jgi:hypothetical protein